MEKLDFISFDEEILKGYLFLPKQPLCIVQIVHGLEEHGMRYKKFAEELKEKGIGVFVCDQRLHGKTATRIGHTNIKDIFPIMVKDQCLISNMLLQKFNLPLVIFGHSYGSFIVQRYLQVCKNYTSAILSGSAYMKRADTFLAKIISHMTIKIKGGDEDAKQIENLVIGSFNRKFKKENGSWISFNKANVKSYEEDELCGIPLCGNFYYSMFKNTRKLYKEREMQKIDKEKPILIASGSDDPVGKDGKSVKKLFENYEKYGIKCQLKLYSGLRHEIINEGEEIVIDDIINFILSSIKH